MYCHCEYITMEARNDRIQLRIQPEVKRLLWEAVAASHTTLSDLVSQAAQARAVEILTERDRIALSPKAAQTFADAL